ncbi:MAG: hypothetical protein OMM_02713 [Candidatus Magnetoglobus multicellularis str. Araruama]|uniref:Calx-beta domain-containing protein n=1 Tax=Candidatus Magnetoglobus multicellularis str. Araruama TaxID=890399 RepID=A0A1V1P8D3_9BACT|nr:MAG: hypothetical protein OMM_02713 [Candidatus Magnetoglobus multicellularis str. Araruama]
MILSGNISTAKSIEINNDTIVELDETIVVYLGKPMTDAVLGTNSVHTVTIMDDDEAQVNWNPDSQSVNEDAGTVTVTAKLDQPDPGETITVTYSLTGSALQGVDYIDDGDPIQITPGAISGQKQITIINDTLVELDETIILKMDDPTNAQKGTKTDNTITIADNDFPNIEWQIISQSIAEGNTQIALIASLDQVYTKADVTASVTVSGTATSTKDYLLLDNNLRIVKGTTSDALTVTIKEDQDVEPNETIILSIVNPVNATLTATSVHTLTITDKDLPYVEWALETQVVDEDRGLVSVSARLDQVHPRADVSIQYTLTGTATNGVDYTLDIDTLTIKKENDSTPYLSKFMMTQRLN